MFLFFICDENRIFDFFFISDFLWCRYIGGTLNYMGSGNLNMEYPYDNNPNHYNLWKPSNGYFPRGEAPPPYEEAVALAQAEAMNAACTMRFVTVEGISECPANTE